MAKSLADTPIEWSRLSAVELPLENFLGLESYCGDRALGLLGRDLTRGELGCFLSHLAVIDRFLDSDAEYCVALEDDVQITSEAYQDFSEIFEWLEGHRSLDWSCLNLSGVYHKRYRVVKRFKRACLRKSYQFPVLTSALLWNRAGATAFRKMVQQEGLFFPVDFQLRYHLARTGLGLSLDRPLFEQVNLGSTIGDRGPGKSFKLTSKAYLLAKLPLYLWSTFHRIVRT